MSYKSYTICLTGNPNVGKSSIFNNLTGLNQHVGNYPGVTIEKKEGFFVKNEYKIKVVDLPGIYSLSATSDDEIVSRNFLLEEKPDLIVDIIDASNLERNLYLYAQLKELDIPIILAMNMMDMMESNGTILDLKKLEKDFGILNVALVANKNIGTNGLIDKIIEVLSTSKNDKKEIFPIDFGEEINDFKTKIKNFILQDKNFSKSLPLDFLALSLMTEDEYTLKRISSLPNYENIVSFIKNQKNSILKKYDEEIEVIIADKIYSWIDKILESILSQNNIKKKNISETIDKIVLNKFLAIPIFAIFMYLMFKFTFTCSLPFVILFEKIIDNISKFLNNTVSIEIIRSFLVDGLVAGVGGVLGFFPLILFMFFSIAFFEDTGYMARAVFIMDRVMRKFELHGKSFASMIIATNGCGVPALMATRTIEDKKDRLSTLLVTSFMICGAKLPIFALIIGAFFDAKSAPNIMFLMYLISIFLALGSSFLFRKTIFKGESSYFVMELPPYRIPLLKSLLLKMWQRGCQYLKKAGTIVLFVSMIIWFGLTFPKVKEANLINLSNEEIRTVKLENSFIGKIGNSFEPVLKPIGFDGKIGIALITGIFAKELVVSTLGTIYSLGEIGEDDEEGILKDKLKKDPFWNKKKAITFLIFCLIYMPCIAFASVFYKEAGELKWLLFLIFWTTFLSYIISFFVYNLLNI